jgi:molecular chaperone GrpE
MTKKHNNKEHEEVTPNSEFSGSEAFLPGETPEEFNSGDEQTIGKLEEEVAAINDKYLRLYSEFDNYRKRTLKEKADLTKTASVDVISSLLPVIDDLERAIRAFQVSESCRPLQEGVVLIYNKLTTLLGQKGLEPITTTGEPFNTDDMEAITTIPAPEPGLVGKVIDEIEKGYVLNGKVIRFAKVVVGT